jgi:hypothetical protein
MKEGSKNDPGQKREQIIEPHTTSDEEHDTSSNESGHITYSLPNSAVPQHHAATRILNLAPLPRHRCSAPPQPKKTNPGLDSVETSSK